MSATHIALLGAIAGFTIFLGLPIGRLRNPAPTLRALLNAVATGILLFLLWDILSHAWEPVDEALADRHLASALGNGAVLTAGVVLGLVGLVYFDRWVARRGTTAGRVGAADVERTAGSTDPRSAGGPGGVAIATDVVTAAAQREWHSPAGQLALLIAVGIGLHNFAEGLAIGNSAAAGELSLAIMLIIGFGLHNATEGFGIVAPLAAVGVRPSWAYLGMLGLIGGGPTLLGTLIGQRFTSTTVSVAFLALAAGSILYVVIELLAVARRFSRKEITTWGLAAGLFAGFLTDGILVAAGA
jgi:ZIP family zinc transporter